MDSIDGNIPLEISKVEHPSLGTLWAAGNDQGLAYFAFGLDQEECLQQISIMKGFKHSPIKISDGKNGLPHTALEQVKEYLAGKRQQFSIPVNWQPYTNFQAAVYRAVIEVPFGQTRTYSQIAVQLGRPNAVRAVGSANASNPLPFIIPCHRLVGKDGSLRGYGGIGGIKTKQWLLDLEKQYSAE